VDSEHNEEISMYQVMQIFISKWKILVILGLIGVLGALIKHKVFPVYPAQGKLLIKDSKNSQIQSFISGMVGNVGGLSVSKGYDSATKASTFLDTNDFFLSMVKGMKIYQKEASPEQKDVIEEIFVTFKHKKDEEELNQSVANWLRSKVKFNPSKGGQIIVKVSSKRKARSVFLVNYALSLAKEKLVERELQDFDSAERYFVQKIDEVKVRLDKLEEDQIGKRSGKGNLTVEMQKGDTGSYLKKLQEDVNDINLRLSENSSQVRILKKKAKRERYNGDITLNKFGAASRLQTLIDENRQLKSVKRTKQRYIKRFGGKGKKLLPVQLEIDKMKASYTFEYKIYESLRGSLAKIGLQKTYLKNKVEILEGDRMSRVRSRPGLFMMMLIALMISQVIGLGGIYLFELFKPLEDSSL
jgi:capsular polysaccharide biosynthesis protein